MLCIIQNLLSCGPDAPGLKDELILLAVTTSQPMADLAIAVQRATYTSPTAHANNCYINCMFVYTTALPATDKAYQGKLSKVCLPNSPVR